MQRARKRTIGLNILLAAAASTILVAIIYGAQLFSARTSQLANAAFDIGQAQMKINRAFSDVLEAESSQRGYLVTHDEVYLQPFDAARVRVASDIADVDLQFRKLGRETAIASLDEFKSLVARKLSELEQTLTLAKQGHTEEALAIVRGNLGFDLMSRARAIVAEQQSSLAGLRADRVAALQDSARKLTLLTSLGVLAVIILSLIAILQMAYQTRELDRAQEKLAASYDALEGRVRERTRDLQRANDEIQRYAYVVSHDLRAPLVNIIGFTRELETALQTIKTAFDSSLAEARDPVMTEAGRAIAEDIPEALRFIQSSTSRMDNLINAILRLSRLGRHALRPQELDLNALVDDCIANVQHQANQANAAIAIEGRLPHIIGDRNALEQIIGNLLDNAVKYLSPERDGRIVVRGKRQGALVLIDIQDNGRGVAPADQERIFDLFRRAGAQDRPGDGIGLAHVRSLIRRMSGDIKVKSDGNSGATFSIALPYDLRPAILQENSHESA